MSLSPVKAPILYTKKADILLAILGLLITLIVVNLSIYNYEKHLTSADKVLLELAPVDPRSLMQGDYMALDYAISNQIMKAIEADLSQTHPDSLDSVYQLSGEGLAVIKIDSHGVGHFDHLTKSSEADEIDLAANELLLYYRIRHGQVKLATNAFFFQEGHGKAYEAARYGLFRINEKGKPLLTDMVDKDFVIIEGDSID